MKITQERNHPNHWFNRASDHMTSAGVLWHAMQSGNGEKIGEKLGYAQGHSMSVACYPVYHMLCGLALELIMKAVLVQRKSEQNIKTHNLNKLANLLNTHPDKETADLLQFYTEASIWAGRYPTPTKSTDEKLIAYWELASNVLTSEIEIGAKTTLKFRQGNDSDSWENFCALWKKYADLFDHYHF